MVSLLSYVLSTDWVVCFYFFCSHELLVLCMNNLRLCVFVCDCRYSPQQRVYKTQGNVSTHPPVKTRLPAQQLLPHPKPQTSHYPQPQTHQQTLSYQSRPWSVQHPQTFPRRMGLVHWPWGAVGLRGARHRARPHLLQDWPRLPWQRWNWRVCWTPQSFLLWVLRDGGAEGKREGVAVVMAVVRDSTRVLYRLNKVGLREPSRPNESSALCGVFVVQFEWRIAMSRKKISCKRLKLNKSVEV